MYQFSEQLTWRVISPEKRGRETWDKMSGQNDKFIICLGAVCLYPVSVQSLTTREGFFSISTVFKYSQRLKYTTTNYCGIIIVRGGSMFVDLLVYPYQWIYVPMNIWQSNKLSYIGMQQTSYKLKYIQTNQQQFDNQRILTPPRIKMIPQHRTYKYNLCVYYGKYK